MGLYKKIFGKKTQPPSDPQPQNEQAMVGIQDELRLKIDAHMDILRFLCTSIGLNREGVMTYLSMAEKIGMNYEAQDKDMMLNAGLIAPKLQENGTVSDGFGQVRTTLIEVHAESITTLIPLLKDLLINFQADQAAVQENTQFLSRIINEVKTLTQQAAAGKVNSFPPTSQSDLDPQTTRPHTASKYPDWAKLREDLYHLPEGFLDVLRNAMVIITLEAGQERAVVVTRADESETQTQVLDTAPVRCHVEFFSGRNGDIFGIYPLVFDNPQEPYFKETWLSPYDQTEVDAADPHSLESRKRLRLLLTQTDTWIIFVDKRDQILRVRKADYTQQQKQKFHAYNSRLDRYAGKTIEKMTYFALIQEYLNTIPMAALQREFLQLMDQKPSTPQEASPQQPGGPSFKMPVTDVFSIKGVGTVVCGQVALGEIKVGDTVEISFLGKIRQTVIKGISISRKQIAQAKAGDNAALLLQDVSREELLGQQAVIIKRDT
jgi:hypothetical protein